MPVRAATGGLAQSRRHPGLCGGSATATGSRLISLRPAATVARVPVGTPRLYAYSIASLCHSMGKGSHLRSAPEGPDQNQYL